MNRRRVVQGGSLLWAAVGGAIAFSSLGEVNHDARGLVLAAATVGTLAAVAASVLLSIRATRAPGVLLVLSGLITPTYFAYALNLPVIAVGSLLLIRPNWLDPDPSNTHELIST